jgi:hypothetical protein
MQRKYVTLQMAEVLRKSVPRLLMTLPTALPLSALKVRTFARCRNQNCFCPRATTSLLPWMAHLPRMCTASRWVVVLLGALLVGPIGCARSYRVHPVLTPDISAFKRVAIVPIRSEVVYRGLGSLVIASSDKEESFRDSLSQAADTTLREAGLGGVVMVGPGTSLPRADQDQLVFECDLERRKILTELSLQGSFTRYANYISRPPLTSVASEALTLRARELGVSAFMLIKTHATSLTGLEYLRELIRGFVITALTFFIDTTIAHRSYISGDVIIIDGESGAALFFNAVTDFSGNPGTAEDTLEYLRELLKPLRERLE